MRTPDRIDYLFALARLVLFWEILWRALLPLICVIGLFGALALLQLPAQLPAWGHAVLLAVFAVLLIAAIWLGYKSWRVPEEDAALRRLEDVARGAENTVPATLECVRAYATLGEISDVFRGIFGEFGEQDNEQSA